MVLFLSTSVFASLEVQFPSQNQATKLEVTNFVCRLVGADLDVVVQGERDTSLKLTLKNYLTVQENAPKTKALAFSLTHPSVGTLEISHEGIIRSLRPSLNSALAQEKAEPSTCKVEAVSEQGRTTLSLQCGSLLPTEQTLTIGERIDSRLSHLSGKVNGECK